jgi:hypothetical protein
MNIETVREIAPGIDREKYFEIYMSESNIQFILDFSRKRKEFDTTSVRPSLENIMKTSFKEHIDTLLNSSSGTFEKDIGTLNKHAIQQFLLNIETIKKSDRKVIKETLPKGDEEYTLRSAKTKRSKSLLISSKNRDSITYPNPNDYCIAIDLKNVTGISMSSLIFRNRVYNIDKTNNKLTLIEKNQELQVSIPLGTYTIENLTETLQTKLSEVSIQNSEYKVYVDKLLKKVVISQEDETIYSYTKVFGLKFTSEMNKTLGFSRTEYHNNNQYVADSFYNLSQNDIMFLKLNKQFNRIDAGNDKGIFGIIDISKYEFNKTIHLENVSSFSWEQPVSVDNIVVQWEDIDGAPIHLNSDHIICLDFDFADT